jgi:hypothetical protein
MTRSKRPCIQQLELLVKAFSDPCEGMVYHYTASVGLRGIIETGDIWLTNTAFVNDTTECRALHKARDLFSDSDFTNKYVREAWEWFKRWPPGRDNYYIASFSRERDSLTQWRAYGNFCLGFEARDLARKPFSLYRCIYDEGQIRDWMLEKERVPEWDGDSLDDPRKETAARNLLFTASIKYKDANYRGEEEIRLMAVSHHSLEPYEETPSMYEKEPPIYFRDDPLHAMPVPYVKFYIPDGIVEKVSQGGPETETARRMKERKLKEETERRRELLPIREIWIGPMLEQERAKIACEILLREKGYKDVEVITSQIPYRGP